MGQLLAKFHESVPEDLRYETNDFLRAKYVAELTDWCARSTAPLAKFLLEKGYWTVLHVWGVEVVPLHIWVDNYLAQYPDSKHIILEAMQNNGLSDESIRKFAPKLLEPLDNLLYPQEELLWITHS